jgi:predicted ATPase
MSQQRCRSLIARLDRLPAAKHVAQIGAVIGREFAHPLLAAVANMPQARLVREIDMLVTSGLAFRRGTPPEAVYTFKHALVRDAAYNTLLRTQRQQLHALIGQTLERRFPETAEAEPEVLAHHFTQAGATEKAIGYWHQAGERSLRRSANAEASAHLRRAIKLLGTLPGGQERDRTELSLQTAIGTATRALTGHASDESLGVYSRARRLLNPGVPIKDQMSVLYGLWSVNIVRCEQLASRDVAQQSMDLAAHSNDPETLAFAHRMLGFTLWVAGESAAAVPLLQRVVALLSQGKTT